MGCCIAVFGLLTSATRTLLAGSRPMSSSRGAETRKPTEMITQADVVRHEESFNCTRSPDTQGLCEVMFVAGAMCDYSNPSSTVEVAVISTATGMGNMSYQPSSPLPLTSLCFRFRALQKHSMPSSSPVSCATPTFLFGPGLVKDLLKAGITDGGKSLCAPVGR